MSKLKTERMCANCGEVKPCLPNGICEDCINELIGGDE